MIPGRRHIEAAKDVLFCSGNSSDLTSQPIKAKTNIDLECLLFGDLLQQFATLECYQFILERTSSHL